MIRPILQRRKVSLRETAVWSRPGFGLADQGAGSSGRQERQPVGTASPAWPGPGKSRDGRPVARQQARNGVGGGRRRKGNRLWTTDRAAKGHLEGSEGLGEPGSHRTEPRRSALTPQPPRALPGFGPRCLPLGLVLRVGVRRRSRASLTPQPKGSAPDGKCAGVSAGHAGSHPVWAQCPGPRHTFVLPAQDGSLEALPCGAVVSQRSHMGGGQRGPRRLPEVSPPPPRPSGSCHSSRKNNRGN